MTEFGKSCPVTHKIYFTVCIVIKTENHDFKSQKFFFNILNFHRVALKLKLEYQLFYFEIQIILRTYKMRHDGTL